MLKWVNNKHSRRKGRRVLLMWQCCPISQKRRKERSFHWFFYLLFRRFLGNSWVPTVFKNKFIAICFLEVKLSGFSLQAGGLESKLFKEEKQKQKSLQHCNRKTACRSSSGHLKFFECKSVWKREMEGEYSLCWVSLLELLAWLFLVLVVSL